MSTTGGLYAYNISGAATNAAAPIALGIAPSGSTFVTSGPLLEVRWRLPSGENYGARDLVVIDHFLFRDASHAKYSNWTLNVRMEADNGTVLILIPNLLTTSWLTDQDYILLGSAGELAPFAHVL